MQSQAVQNAENMDLDLASPNPCFLHFAKDKIEINPSRFSLKMHRCMWFAPNKFDKNSYKAVQKFLTCTTSTKILGTNGNKVISKNTVQYRGVYCSSTGTSDR
jgi:hypothetical protein